MVVGVVINRRLSLSCSFVVCIHFSNLPTPESCCVCVLHSRPVTGQVNGVVGMSPWRVTYHPSHVLPWALQEVKVEAFSVNEADYRCCNLLVAGPEEGERTSSWCGCVEYVLPLPY